MDKVIETVVLNAPNVIVAIMVLLWSLRRVEKSIDENRELIDRLMELIDDDDDCEVE